VKQFQLVVDQRILGRLLFAQGTLLLQLRAPERFDAVHAGPEFLVGQLEFLLEVGQFAVQVGVLVLEFAQEVSGVAGVGHEVAATNATATDTTARRLSGPGRHRTVRIIVQRRKTTTVTAVSVERSVVAVVAVLAAGVGEYATAAGIAVQRLVPGRRHDAHPIDGTTGATGPVGRAAGRSHGPSPVVQQHRTVQVVVSVVRRRDSTAATADAHSSATDARLMCATATAADSSSAVVVGRPGARSDRSPAYRAVPLAATSTSARSRGIRPGRRPVDRRKFSGYAPGAARRTRSSGA